MLVEEFLVREPLHLVLGEHTLGYKMLYGGDDEYWDDDGGVSMMDMVMMTWVGQSGSGHEMS